jgi:hypothetical protein
MPRGSKPGERRGGRQKGTPNKKTVLLNAAIKAAGSEPNVSPLDFLLGLMRDPNLPLEHRVSVAEAALPLVHAKPKELPLDQAAARKYGASQNGVNINEEVNSSAHDIETAKVEAVTPERAGGADLLPLDFLLSVMRDPDVAPQLRIRVAAMVAPFVHPKPSPAKSPIDDPYGFDIDAELAWAIWANTDWSSHDQDTPLCHPRVVDDALEPHVARRLKTLKCPEAFGEEQARTDTSRLVQLSKTRNALTKKQRSEAAHLAARLEIYKRGPEAEGRLRIEDLQKRPSLTAEEQSELDRLQASYPAFGYDNPLAHLVGPLTEALARLQAER